MFELRGGAALCALTLGSLAAAPGVARAEDRREDTCFNERHYLSAYPDVEPQVKAGAFPSARAHFEAVGRREARLACTADDVLPRVGQGWRVALLVAMVAGVWALRRRRGWGPVKVSVGYAVALALFAYFDYVFGRRSFVFRDIASDTVVQFWPMMSHLSSRLWRGELPLWSFGVGVGQNVFPSWLADPFALVAILSGKGMIAHLLGPLQVAKIAVAAASVAAFLRLRGYGPTATTVGALSVAFCGHMVSRGTWYEYATEVAIISFYLWALERFLQTRRFALLAIATGLIGGLGTYHSCLYALLSVIVTTVRVFAFPDRLFARPARAYAGYVLASLAGVLLASVVLLPDLYTTLSSTRVSGEGEVLSGFRRMSWARTEDVQTVLTALARAISPNLLGNAGHYSGPGNYLEDPLSYAGLLALVSVLPCFVMSTRRERVVLGVFVAALLAYHELTFFRVAINAFAGLYFKISGFWGGLGLALVAAKAIDGLEKRGEVPQRAFAASVVLWLGLLALLDLRAPAHGLTLFRDALWGAVAILFALGGVLLAGRPGASAPLRLQAIVAIVLLEFAGTSLLSVGKNRDAVDGVFPERQSGYEDAAKAAVARLRLEDPSFYRIERERGSVYLLDSLMQGYFGTQSYLSFSNPAYVQFQDAIGLINRASGRDARPESSLGSLGPRSLVLPLLGIRYYFASAGGVPIGYTKRFELADFAVYGNPKVGGLGFFYPRTIVRQEYDRFEEEFERAGAMLHAAVIEKPLASVPAVTHAELKPELLRDFHGCTNSSQCLEEDSVVALVSALSERAVELTHFEENRIEGRFAAPSAGVLFLSIPYDRGWELRIDGAAVAPLKIQAGFLGAEVGPGEHRFALKFRPPGLVPGAVGAAIGALALAVASWVARRRPAATSA